MVFQLLLRLGFIQQDSAIGSPFGYRTGVLPRSINTTLPLSWIGLIAAELSGKVLITLACQLYPYAVKPMKWTGAHGEKDASLAKSGPDCEKITLERLSGTECLQSCEIRQIWCKFMHKGQGSSSLGSSEMVGFFSDKSKVAFNQPVCSLNKNSSLCLL